MIVEQRRPGRRWRAPNDVRTSSSGRVHLVLGQREDAREDGGRPRKARALDLLPGKERAC